MMGCLAAPAVRIGVRYLLGSEQRTALTHVGDDALAGFLIVHSGIGACILGLIAAVIDRNYHIHLIALAGHIVVRTEAGRGMNASGTAFHGDIVCAEQNAVAVKEGMARLHVFKLAAGKRGKRLISVDTRCRKRLFRKCGCKDVYFARGNLCCNVLLARMYGNCKVARERPCGRRPDNEIGIGKVECVHLLIPAGIGDAET